MVPETFVCSRNNRFYLWPSGIFRSESFGSGSNNGTSFKKPFNGGDCLVYRYAFDEPGRKIDISTLIAFSKQIMADEPLCAVTITP